LVETPVGKTPGNGARRTVFVNDVAADAVAASASTAIATADASKNSFLISPPLLDSEVDLKAG
jgi:hypothetical protein